MFEGILCSFPVTVVSASAPCNPTGSFPRDLIAEIAHREAAPPRGIQQCMEPPPPQPLMKCRVPQNLTAFCGNQGRSTERRIQTSFSSHKSWHQLPAWGWMVRRLLTVLSLRNPLHGPATRLRCTTTLREAWDASGRASHHQQAPSRASTSVEGRWAGPLPKPEAPPHQKPSRGTCSAAPGCLGAEALPHVSFSQESFRSFVALTPCTEGALGCL